MRQEKMSLLDSPFEDTLRLGKGEFERDYNHVTIVLLASSIQSKKFPTKEIPLQTLLHL